MQEELFEVLKPKGLLSLDGRGTPIDHMRLIEVGPA